MKSWELGTSVRLWVAAWLDANEDVRVVVLSAEGRNFCAGIDVSTPESLGAQLGQSPNIKGELPGRKAEALYRRGG